MKKIFIISGIPGVGKSTYGKWLENEKGFIYWDVEHETLDNLSIRNGISFGNGMDIGEFLKKMNSINNVGVIDWGFPPDKCLETIRNFKNNGLSIWWFDGDRKAARESFLKRDTVSEQDLDIQMKKIEHYWTQIKDLYGDNIINVLKKGPEYISPNIIYNRMFN